MQRLEGMQRGGMAVPLLVGWYVGGRLQTSWGRGDMGVWMGVSAEGVGAAGWVDGDLTVGEWVVIGGCCGWLRSWFWWVL